MNLRKIFLLSLLYGLYTFSYSDIKIKIYEPIRFKNVNVKAIGDLVVGEGSLEISTDNLEADLNKKLIFRFPDKGAMTNKKRWIEIEKYMMDKNEKDLIITSKKRIVKIYALLRRDKLKKYGDDASIVEGEYIGRVPIYVEQYSQATKDLNEAK